MPGSPVPLLLRVCRQDNEDPDMPSPSAAPGGDPEEEPPLRPAGDGHPTVTPALCQDRDPNATPSLPVRGTLLSPLHCAMTGIQVSLICCCDGDPNIPLALCHEGDPNTTPARDRDPSVTPTSYPGDGDPHDIREPFATLSPTPTPLPPALTPYLLP